ncbi:hypothetical protein GCK72_002761 [Caenorhabditis remanei]|uniref:Uncharacterized protein n=1 Tax=Caenorhabditis remanei TaxID=31234 RepID=A0A6A5HWZ6_CAERE|nr:hypothetical protein GCK72_002761 [Caenorhabditis remanei]KAF1770937.1 hypothetical protein GCK72_002761 [Caenorhabditis remanei]
MDGGPEEDDESPTGAEFWENPDDEVDNVSSSSVIESGAILRRSSPFFEESSVVHPKKPESMEPVESGMAAG